MTRACQAVIEVLDGTDEHLTADEIVARAEESAPGVHRATVYRALGTLGDLGLVTHTHVGGSATVYHLAVPAPSDQTASTPHAHLQCTNCQAVIDFPVDALDSLITRVDREVGFLIEPHHAALLGLCADCRRSSPSEKVVTSDSPESIQLCRLRPLSASGEPMDEPVGEAGGGGVGAE